MNTCKYLNIKKLSTAISVFKEVITILLVCLVREQNKLKYRINADRFSVLLLQNFYS
jgi:hypothetical protein